MMHVMRSLIFDMYCLTMSYKKTLFVNVYGLMVGNVRTVLRDLAIAF